MDEKSNFPEKEILDLKRFLNLGVIKNEPIYDSNLLDHFWNSILEIRSQSTWKKEALVELFHSMIPDFDHKETGKYLDGRM